MNFANNFLEITHSDNCFSDGLLSCAYSELPKFLDILEDYLIQQKVSIQDCLAVECNNSVPSALLLILLLKRGQGFMLLPPSENKEQVSVLKPIPQFCQHRLVIQSIKKANATSALEHPEQFLIIEACNAKQPRIETQGKLFLRTSGSMGAAKIVVHSHENVLGSARNVIEKYGFTYKDRFAIPVPIFHLYGFGAEFLPAVLLGAAIDLQENTNLLKYLDRERRFNPSVAFVTPNLCEMLLHGRKNSRPYKTIVVSGQRIGEELFRAFDDLCGNHLINQYGSSEMGPIAACSVNDSQDIRVSTIGQPMNGVALRLEGEGELYCQHPFSFLGYMDETGNWLSSAQTWHRTGDVAVYNEKGEIAVTGRADNSLNRSGYLILLADVERMIEQLDYIAQVAVIVTTAQDIQGQKLRAFCVLKKTTQPVEVGKIYQDCQAILPKYALPDEIVILEKFPLLPSGKTDQQVLRNWLEKDNTSLLSKYRDKLQTKAIFDEKTFTQTAEFDFQKALHALIELQSVNVDEILRSFFSETTTPVLLAGNGHYGLNHIGFECCHPLDVILETLPMWLKKFSSTLEKPVTLAKSLRFCASHAFQQRVGANVEILCLWFQIEDKLFMLELFDIARPITNLLITNSENQRFVSQSEAMEYLFSGDNIWHYSINVGTQEQVEALHHELQTLCEQNISYKLAYSAPIQNQYDGSFHTKLINLKCHLELEFAKMLGTF